jgi:hypothetical protein
MNDREHLATLVATLAIEAIEKNAVHIADDALLLLRIGKQANTLAVRRCNGEGHWEGGRWHWDDADEARADRKQYKLHEKAQAIAARYNATTEIGGDPRGCVLRIFFKSGVRNGWGEGYGVA